MTTYARIFQKADKAEQRAFCALACAESLTDSVALKIYQQFAPEGEDANAFVSAFKYSGLTEPRNSEWSLLPGWRNELQQQDLLNEDEKSAIHQILLDIADDPDGQKKAGSEFPSYLFTPGGRAYHLAALGNVDQALAEYSEASKGALTGAQWLGARLASEQMKAQILPGDAVQTLFLQAQVLWREGQREKALPLLRKIADTGKVMREVAISLHLLGNHKKWRLRKEAERELRRSIEINEELGEELHAAHAQHSLANLLSKLSGREEEAEKHYSDSLEVHMRLHDEIGAAQTMHSYANLLSRQAGRESEAENLYSRSIALRSPEDDQFGIAQTMHSYANLLSRQTGRKDEAEDLYWKSINIGKKIGQELHVAKVRHSLANLLSEDRLDEARKLYQDSLRTLRRRNNQVGIAQTLRSFALALSAVDKAAALEMLSEALEINLERADQPHADMIQRDIDRIK